MTNRQYQSFANAAVADVTSGDTSSISGQASALTPALLSADLSADLHAQGAVERFRVLVVDDDPISQRQLAHFLAQTGIEVLTASNGQEWLRMASQESPHLVITDWIMAEMDGPELLG